ARPGRRCRRAGPLPRVAADGSLSTRVRRRASPAPARCARRAAHLDRQRHRGEYAFRPRAQHRLRRRRAPTLHAVPARAAAQPVHRAAGFHALGSARAPRAGLTRPGPRAGAPPGGQARDARATVRRAHARDPRQARARVRPSRYARIVKREAGKCGLPASRSRLASMPTIEDGYRSVQSQRRNSDPFTFIRIAVIRSTGPVMNNSLLSRPANVLFVAPPAIGMFRMLLPSGSKAITPVPLLM